MDSRTIANAARTSSIALGARGLLPNVYDVVVFIVIAGIFVALAYGAGQMGGAGEAVVLDDVDLTLSDNEIVGLLGRSGCGKSTLLRIIAGLMRPTAGSVTIDGEAVTAPASQVAMVFQSFALFPWLTVLENVEIGLEAQGVDPEARKKRALAAIDLIGLDGYESAYPKELSGGMRQRVGLARALVVHPKVLLMDEPFRLLTFSPPRRCAPICSICGAKAACRSSRC